MIDYKWSREKPDIDLRVRVMAKARDYEDRNWCSGCGNPGTDLVTDLLLHFS